MSLLSANRSFAALAILLALLPLLYAPRVLNAQTFVWLSDQSSEADAPLPNGSNWTPDIQFQALREPPEKPEPSAEQLPREPVDSSATENEKKEEEGEEGEDRNGDEKGESEESSCGTRENR